MRVLVVEDEVLIALEITLIVEQMGHEVVGIASDSTEALEMARGKPPELALVDLHLADGRTGGNVAKGIRQAHNTTVLFVTSHPDLAGEHAGRGDGSFTKPFTSYDLKRAVSAVTARMASLPVQVPLPIGLRLYN